MSQRRGPKGQRQERPAAAASRRSRPVPRESAGVDARVNSLLDRVHRAAQQQEMEETPETLPEEPALVEAEADEVEEPETPLPRLLDDEGEFVLGGAVHAEDVQRARQESIQVDAVGDDDLDRLWDWVRADEDKGFMFLGIRPDTSSALRAQMAKFGEHLFAIREESLKTGERAHIGFVGMNNVTDISATVHLYLGPAVRGRARDIVPKLMAIAERDYPGMRFTVITPLETLARLYAGIGFKKFYLLIWQPGTAAAP